MDRQVIIIDDDTGLLSIMKTTLLSAGFAEPVLVSDSRTALEIVRQGNFCVALIDLVMPHINGMEVLRQIREARPAIECIIITAIDEVSKAVEAMRYGAYDYLIKPLESERLILTLQRAIENYMLKHEITLLKEKPSFAQIKTPAAFTAMVAADEAMAKVFSLAESAAATDYNILITGESGTGKEILARIIHNLSSRRTGPFVAVNMASFNKALFEDSFFGHEKGAFTGAHTDAAGFFDKADKGTIFLDEISEMDLPSQAKFLRVIQEKEFYRIGSVKVKQIDVRFLAASNRDIKEEINEKRFREDLYYRLNTFHIHIPPLRERKKDIIPLAGHFLKEHAARNNKSIVSLSPELANALQRYSYPGNVRELESIIARALIKEESSILRLAAAEELAATGTNLNHNHIAGDQITLKNAEKRHIQKILESTGNNRTQAAKILGVSLRTLQRKLKMHKFKIQD